MRVTFHGEEFSHTINLNPMGAIKEWLEARAKRKAKNDLAILLKQAAMNEFQWNTNVIRATDNNGRLSVGSSLNRDFDDTIAVGFYLGNSTWRHVNISTSRARLMAKMLVERADAIEEIDGQAHDIDKPQEFIDGLKPGDQYYNLYHKA
jgi:hypothetical protein